MTDEQIQDDTVPLPVDEVRRSDGEGFAANARREPVACTCSECGSENIIYDGESGEIICGSCGLVLRESTVNKGPGVEGLHQE